MNGIHLRIRLATVLLVLGSLSLASCSGSPSVTLKTLELSPSRTGQANPFFAGTQGTCIGAAAPPQSSFSAGSGQLMVGFDNFFDEGFFCDRLRAQVFRGVIEFGDVSQFDSIVSANLIFETQRSLERINETIGQNPPKSFATTLGLALVPHTGSLQFDTDAPLFARAVP